MSAASHLGRHLLADLHGVAAARLADPDAIAAMMQEAAVAAGAMVLFAHFHHFGDDQGVTGVLLLQESHISIHTWPEHGYAAVDVFMCGHAQPEKAVAVLVESLQPAQVVTREEARGSLPLPLLGFSASVTAAQ